MNIKKSIALSLIFILLLGLTTFAAPEIPDVDDTLEALDADAEIFFSPEELESEFPEEPESEFPEEPESEFPEEPAPEEELYGEWYGNVYGLTICLSLKEDGIYGVAFTETSQEERLGTWVLDEGFIYMDEEEIPSISALKDSLAWTATGAILTREKEESYTPAAVYADATPEDFAGYWKSAYVETDGAMFDASALQNNTDIYIEGINVALGGPLFGDVIEVFEFADGTMTYQDGDDNASAQITMQMLEDGYLAVTLTTTFAMNGETGDSALKILLAPVYTPYLDMEETEE